MPKLRQVFAPTDREPAQEADASTGPKVKASDETVTASSEDGELVEVTARHAIRGHEIRVRLPGRARFCHVKQALARCLGDDEVATKASLVTRQEDGYDTYRDKDPIGSVRTVLVVNADFGEHRDELVEFHPSASELAEAVVATPSRPAPAAPRGAALEEVTREGESDEEASQIPAKNLFVPKRRVPTGTGFVGNVKNKNLTRQHAFSLQKELYDGFKRPEFQKKLRLLREKASPLEDGVEPSMTNTEFLRLRQDLMLEVQSEVLPKYGFEGTPAGVYKMFGAMAPFIRDKEFKRIAEEINDLIGLASPADTWKNLSKTCYTIKFRDTTCDPIIDDTEERPSALADGQPSSGPGRGSASSRRSALLARAVEVIERKGELAVGQTYEVSDGTGNWKRATVIAAKPKAQVYTVQLLDETDGLEETPIWEDVARERFRPLGGAPAGGAVTNAAPLMSEPDDVAKARTYHLAGTWDDWKDLRDMYKSGVDGSHMIEVTVPAGKDIQFQVISDNNWNSRFYPELDGEGIIGPSAGGHGRNFQAGSVEQPSILRVQWNPTGKRSLTFDWRNK